MEHAEVLGEYQGNLGPSAESSSLTPALMEPREQMGHSYPARHLDKFTEPQRWLGTPSAMATTLLLPTHANFWVQTYFMYVLVLPLGKTYGCFFRKTCPTRLHGMISRLPLHIHTRKEISARQPHLACHLLFLLHLFQGTRC